MKTLLILCSLFTLSSLAQVQIQVIDPEIDTQELEKKGYQVSREESEFSSLPNKDLRDKRLQDLPEAKN
jgi:hypothetical protein